jgi:hypothetical protein
MSTSYDGSLQTLRSAINTGDAETIREAIPEPPNFLSLLFSPHLALADRDALFAGVFPVLEMDEDRWEIIEAAAMDTIARPERRAFIAVAPYISAGFLNDAGELVAQIPDPRIAREAQNALEERAAAEFRKGLT